MQLGGTLSYAGRAEHRPELGTGRAPEPADITRAVTLSRAVTTAAAAIASTPTQGVQRGAGPSIADELAKLASLRDQGILTDEEFQAQKSKLLG